MRIRDPKPEVQRLEELVKEVRFGEIRLPKFQRPFVWNKSDMLNLLDSIYNGYPIGSILLWNSSERLKSERSIFDFDVNYQESEAYPTNYLLDGQQRLTTLCGALFWDGSDPESIWNICFDLESERFLFPGKTEILNYFPLNKLLSTSEFIRQCLKFDTHPQARLYYKNAEKLLESIKNYKIAVVKIGDISLEEIAPIFERINSTGRKLTMVDLMRAATWKGGFDLSETIDSIVDMVSELGFGEIQDSSILRSIAAAAGFGINKADIDRLRNLSSDELSKASAVAKTAIQGAIGFLREDVKMPGLSFLPYAVQLTHLGEFFRLCANPSAQVRNELKKWFWSTSVRRYFAGANTGQNSYDLERMRQFAEGKIDKLDDERDAIDLTKLIFDEFNLRTANSITFALLQVQMSPTISIDAKPIDIEGVPTLSRDIFYDLLRRGDIYHNSNISQIYHPLRRKKGLVKLGEFFPNKDLFVDEEALEGLVSGHTVDFVHARIELIRDELANLTGRHIEDVYL